MGRGERAEKHGAIGGGGEGAGSSRAGIAASKTVISLLCRLAGGLVKLKEALRAGPAGIQRPKRSRVPPNGDGFSFSLAGATWLIE